MTGRARSVAETQQSRWSDCEGAEQRRGVTKKEEEEAALLKRSGVGEGAGKEEEDKAGAHST